MRKRNHTVTIRMNNEEYNLLQNKVKESGRTQQEVVIKAIADLKIASAEEVEELKRLNQMFADILCQLRGATTNINQIARKLHTDGEIPNNSILYFLNKNILKYRKESERIWQLKRSFTMILIIFGIMGSVFLVWKVTIQYKKIWDSVYKTVLILSVSFSAVLGNMIREVIPINLLGIVCFINIGTVWIRKYLENKYF